MGARAPRTPALPSLSITSSYARTYVVGKGKRHDMEALGNDDGAFVTNFLLGYERVKARRIVDARANTRHYHLVLLVKHLQMQ